MVFDPQDFMTVEHQQSVMSNEMEGNQEDQNFGGDLHQQEDIPRFSAVIHSN